MKVTEENIQRVAEVLAGVLTLPGNPYSGASSEETGANALLQHLRSICRFVHDRPIREWIEAWRRNPAAESIGLPEHSYTEKMTDLEWLADQALTRFDRYPQVKGLRDLYSEYFEPFDSPEQHMARLWATPQEHRG